MAGMACTDYHGPLYNATHDAGPHCVASTPNSGVFTESISTTHTVTHTINATDYAAVVHYHSIIGSCAVLGLHPVHTLLKFNSTIIKPLTALNKF